MVCYLERGAEVKVVHNAELHAVYSFPNLIRNLKIETTELGRAFSTYGRIRKHTEF